VVYNTDYFSPAQKPHDADVTWTADIADSDGLTCTVVGSDPHDAVAADTQPLVAFTDMYVPLSTLTSVSLGISTCTTWSHCVLRGWCTFTGHSIWWASIA
jgi:hypothetical protein